MWRMGATLIAVVYLAAWLLLGTSTPVTRRGMPSCSAASGNTALFKLPFFLATPQMTTHGGMPVEERGGMIGGQAGRQADSV